MGEVYPDRTFKILIGSGVVLTLLLGMAVFRVVMASCPEQYSMGTFACLFLPTHSDLGVHLLSYAFMVTIISGTISWLVLWRRQLTMTHSLTRKLTLLHATDSELEPLAQRLGLQGKVQLVDFESPLVFCAGFVSPRVYLSRGVTERLTTEDLEVLLLHEKHHLENHDPLKILLVRLVASAFFFIPALKNMLQRYLIEKEIAADRSAVQYQWHRQALARVMEKLGGGTMDDRLAHLKGHSRQLTESVSLPGLVTSFLITACIIAVILAPLSSSHPV